MKQIPPIDDIYEANFFCFLGQPAVKFSCLLGHPAVKLSCFWDTL